MTKLVALALPGGPGFVDAMRQVWDAGDAILPIDLRLPPPERDRVMAAMAPSGIIEVDGEQRSLPGGAELTAGDALVIPTSGTTGEPKGVVHTHAGIAASAEATSAAINVDPATDRWLACLPLAHVGGLSVVTRALHTGTPLEVHDRFDPSAVVAAIDRGATLVSLVTRTLHQVPIERFRTVVIGGAAPPPDRPANVVATYGMTETGSGVVYERQPIDGVEVRVDANDEVWLRGPMLLRAYRRVDDPLGWDPKDAEGWFPTGDLGTLTPELQIFGRRGDVIVTGAEKVWPARVEPILAAHDDVAEVIVVGRPHPEWGHEVVARVVPTDPASPPTLDALRDLVRAQLPAWYAPRALDIVDHLPKTSLGKIKRTSGPD